MSDTEVLTETIETTVGKRGRGRPKKDSTINNNNGGIETINNGNSGQKVGKKRGRKPSPQKSSSNVVISGSSDGKRGRGRPKGTGGKTAKIDVKSNGKKGGKRGRPKKTESVEEEAAPLDDEDNEDNDVSHEEEEDEEY